MGEDQNQILARVARGELSAEEGSELLAATNSIHPAQTGLTKPGTLRVKITNVDSGRVKLSINIPLSLVEVGIGMGARFAPHLDDSAFEQVADAVREGSAGKVLEIFEENSRERVEVWIE
ncbi:MAG: hypothetical protein JXJ17_17945 [Anaerolineae bacterium]|nr:hypothetical protein [Anaerolineae bacterium]